MRGFIILMLGMLWVSQSRQTHISHPDRLALSGAIRSR